MRKPSSGIACLILAAGGGSRLGGGKLLLPWRERPIIAHVAATALQTPGFTSVTVVLGHEAGTVRDAVSSSLSVSSLPENSPSLRFAENAHWREGQSTSLRLGIETLLAGSDGNAVHAVLVLLGDQPLVTPRTLRALLEAHERARNHDPDHPATAPFFQGRRGNPVILSRAMFPGVLALQGDVGARGLLADLGERLLLVPVDDPGVLFDVDTREAYAALRDGRV